MVKLSLVIIVRKYIIFIVLAIVLSFFLGMYLYKIDRIDEELAFDTKYINSKGENAINQAEEILKATNSTEDKITPDTKIIEKLYYNDCNHIVQTEKSPTKEMINKTEDEFQAEYIGWEIQKFTNVEVVVYKDVYAFCDEHYCIKDLDGTIVVYKLDKYGKEKELIKKTEIQTKYLSDVDIDNLKKGIIVYNKADVNKKLEDFE